MGIKARDLDVAKYLQDDEDIRLLLEVAAEEGDPAHFVRVLNVACRAKGMTQLARDAGVSRTGLYKALSEDGNPEFDTIFKVVKALGCRFSVVADTPSVSESVENVERVADDRETVC